jgi:hypothetical protein
MQVRATTLRRGNKTYQYAQLVESYRREHDGMPVHRVVANLGRISDPVQLENLKARDPRKRVPRKIAADLWSPGNHPVAHFRLGAAPHDGQDSVPAGTDGVKPDSVRAFRLQPGCPSR